MSEDLEDEELVDEETEERFLCSSKGKRYKVGKLLGKAERFNLYVCQLADDRSGILKIAASKEHNEVLDREALTLRLLADRAAEVEAKNRGKKPYNYTSFFPVLEDSFIASDQNDRRVNILSFCEDIKQLGQLTPIAALSEVEGVRVDPRTAAWMFGKMLKVLAFAHDQGISIGAVGGDNILVERELHGVIFFDWTLATTNGDFCVPPEQAVQEIAAAAKLTIEALGGDLEKSSLPSSDQLSDRRFQEFLFRWLRGGDLSSAGEVHRQFYELIWAMWPREFYPFTVYPLKGGK